MKHEFNLRIKYSQGPADKSAFIIAFTKGKSVFESVITELKEFAVTVSGMNIFKRVAPLNSSIILDNIANAKIKIGMGIRESGVVLKQTIDLAFAHLIKIFSDEHVPVVFEQALHTLIKLRFELDSAVNIVSEFFVRLLLKIRGEAPIAFFHNLKLHTKERIRGGSAVLFNHGFNHLNISELVRLGYWDSYKLSQLDSLHIADMDSKDIIIN